MKARIASLGLTLLMLGPAWALPRARCREPDRDRLRVEVERLASREFAGRRRAGGRKAAEHLVEAFRALKLEPLFDGRYLQSIPPNDSSENLGRNVGARLLGADAKLRDQWIVVSAHFDHLGIRDGVLYPGADDNASGVAMMLDVARALVEGAEKPARSIMFIGFDLEEIGLFGSRYFVEHSPVPLKRISLFITADMIGRALAGICDRHVFVSGSEHAPGLRPWIEDAACGRPLSVGLIGSDIMMIDRSDYGPFRARRVPYLFFTTGENPCYHTPRDTPDTLDYPKLEAISRLILGIVRKAASAREVPAWSSVVDNPIAEAATIRDILKVLLANRERLDIGATKALLMSNALRKLEAIVARGSITPAERSGMVNLARLVLISGF